MQTHLARWKNLYRLRRAAQWMLRTLPVGAALSLGFSLPLMFSARLLLREFIALSGLLILGCVLLSGLLALLWPVDALRAARHVESACHLQERLSTALEYQQRSENPLYAALQADAERSAQQVSAWTVLAFRMPPWQLWLTLALLALNVLTGLQRAPFQRAAHKRQVQHAIQQEIQAIDSLRERITQDDSLSPQDKARLEDILAQARQQLASAQSLEEASAALEDSKQLLKTLSPAQTQQLAQALQSGGQALFDNAPLQPVAQALAQGDLLAAAQALQSLNVSQMTASQREAAAGGLNTLAQAVAESNPALSEALRQAAQAVQQNAPDAQQALQQAAQALRQAASQIQQAAAAAQLSQALQAGQQRLLHSGQSGQPAGSSQPGSEANTDMGLWQGDTGTAQGSSGNQPGGASENAPPYDPLNAPDPRLSGGSEIITLPGTSTDGETMNSAGSTLPGTNAPLSVPYHEALPQFLDAYQQALDNEDIPPQLRDIIRQYFGSLEP